MKKNKKIIIIILILLLIGLIVFFVLNSKEELEDGTLEKETKDEDISKDEDLLKDEEGESGELLVASDNLVLYSDESNTSKATDNKIVLVTNDFN